MRLRPTIPGRGRVRDRSPALHPSWLEFNTAVVRGGKAWTRKPVPVSIAQFVPRARWRNWSIIFRGACSRSHAARKVLEVISGDRYSGISWLQGRARLREGLERLAGSTNTRPSPRKAAPEALAAMSARHGAQFRRGTACCERIRETYGWGLPPLPSRHQVRGKTSTTASTRLLGFGSTSSLAYRAVSSRRTLLLMWSRCSRSTSPSEENHFGRHLLGARPASA